MANKGFRLFGRDTVRRLKWVDFENHICDEEWHRVYTIFGIRFHLNFDEINNIDKADNRKNRPASGFNRNRDNGK